MRGRLVITPGSRAPASPARPVHRAESAARAWETTVPFLHKQLG
ncbi:hypothetical protein M2271_006368 [Streptomyces sp. LBL]|nr:hypothetical protein [Streptomyces sp. LBL]MDH6628535.1 hypothetical protein [Streptomyces sp. LBL]